MDEELLKFRGELERLEQAAQATYDKTILSLSGGALAVSFVFVRDIVGAAKVEDPAWLFFSWIFWAAAILSIFVTRVFNALAGISFVTGVILIATFVWRNIS